MARASTYLVLGYYPGNTRATGVRSTKGLQDWAVKIAHRTGDQDALWLASNDPDQFLAVALNQGAVILVFEGSDLTVYSKHVPIQAPQQILDVVRNKGLNTKTQVTWYSDLYMPEPDIEYAGEIIDGLPEPAGAASQKRKPMTRTQLAHLRRQFWSGQTDPSLAPDIVDKLFEQ